METDTKDRLTRADWLAHGLRMLAREGAGALKVGDLAISACSCCSCGRNA